MTLQQSAMKSGEPYEEQLSLFAEDSLANLSPSQVKEKDSLMKLVERYSSRLPERLNKSNHGLYSLKTLEGFYLTTKGELLELSYPPLMNWGTMQNGRYLTAKISEFHKTERGCSLSDILEENVDEKYFLSPEKANEMERFIQNT